jgi:hypothetical protein
MLENYLYNDSVETTTLQGSRKASIIKNRPLCNSIFFFTAMGKKLLTQGFFFLGLALL